MAGIIIGPFGLRLVTDSAVIQGMADLGIVLLLFLVGLELDPLELKAIGSKVLVFSTVEIMVAFLSGLAGSILLGWSTQESLLVASFIAISSTALVSRNLNERKDLSQRSKGLMISALVIEDVIAVIILALLTGLSSGSPIGPSTIGSWTIRSLLLVGLLALLGIYMAPRVIDRISQLDIDLDEAGFLLSLSLGFLMAIVSSQLGFSAATGAFLMGLVIRGKRARFVYSKVRPVRDLFLVVFFVSMGMLTDLSLLLSPTIVLPLLVMAVVGKYAGSYLGALISRERREAGRIAVGMIPRGEFSLIMARDASALGLVQSVVYPIVGAAVLVTSLVSAIVQAVGGRKQKAATTLWLTRPADYSPFEGEDLSNTNARHLT